MIATRRFGATLAVLLAGVLTTACPGSSGKAESVKAAGDGKEQVVTMNFSLPPAGGGPNVDLSKFDGKIRVVDFWATWCPPCRAAIPWLNELHQQYRAQGVEIIGISVDENAKALEGFDKEVHIEYTSLMSSADAEKAFGGIVGLPTTFILDRTGKVVHSYVGEAEKREVEADLHSLLGVRD